MTALLLLIIIGCTTSTNTVEITLPPKPQRSEIGEVKTLSDFARVLNYYENLVEQWEAWGDAIDGILSDDVQNDTKKKKEAEKVAEIKNVRIAVSGIYDYAINELPNLHLSLPKAGAPDWVEQKELYKVYRPAHVLAGAVDMFASLPLTHNHPRLPVDGANFRNLTIGWTGENPWVDYLQESNEVGIRNTVVLYDDEALSAYERGEIQLSPGYNAIFEWQKGTAPNGTEYDIIMKEITGVNHLALLRLGRGGDCAKVLDGAPENNTNASKDHIKKDKDGLPFVKNSKGREDFGIITKEQAQSMQMPAAPIRLSVGSETTYGLKHIEFRHGEQIRNAGYDDIESFVEDITQNFNEIHLGNTAERNGEKVQGFYLVKTTNKGLLGIELEKSADDDFYTINNGGIFGNPHYLKKKKTLWILPQQESSQNGIEKPNGKDVADNAIATSTAAEQGIEFNDSITDPFDSVKTIFDIVRGSVFDRARAV